MGACHVVHSSPPQAFRGVEALRCFGFDVREPGPVRRRKIPGGTVKIVFALDGVFDGRRIEPTPLVVGPHDRGGIAEHSGRMVSVQLQLDPLAARRLLGVPLHELRNSAVDLTDILGPSALQLTYRLAESTDWSARFRLVAEYFRPQTETAERDEMVADAIRRLRDSRGALPISLLADEYGWSRRHFSRRFADRTGLSPKSYGSLMRFSAALTTLVRTPAADLSRLASELGYYDQSHLNRDFQRFAATTPARLLAMSHSSNTDSGGRP
ncbi:AraC family transcriptional regulator [Nocardia mexicana]|uniref:AraC family transcriptional regulator n=1 Tax=Nocardia mexicana TaxID=279262 RepID=A0A370GTR8_9NOCA|nr:AraC family transcriptional regulator [Nocardia mexicana]